MGRRVRSGDVATGHSCQIMAPRLARASADSRELLRSRPDSPAVRAAASPATPMTRLAGA